MTQNELLVLLTGLAHLLRTANKFNINITEQVIGVIQEKIPVVQADHFKLSTGKDLPVPNSFEINLGQLTSKLDMIKEYKNRTGVYLLDAKRVCEEYFVAHGLKFYRS